jgi:hypothetical protein
VATGAKVAGGAAAIYGLYLGVKWTTALFLAPETGGASVAVAAATP